MPFDAHIVRRRITDNHPWWNTGRSPFYTAFAKRNYFQAFHTLLHQTSIHRAVILMGPRRVGKTVMLYQEIQSLLDQGIDPKKIFYFSLDTPIFTNIPPEDLINLALGSAGTSIDGAYVFFDEIQYLRDWERHFKVLVDQFRHTKFIASGSAAAALRMKSLESGAGRFTDFFLPPLTFSEYIELKNLESLLYETKVEFGGVSQLYLARDIIALNQHFIDYIHFGGFPEIALHAENLVYPEQIIQKDITDKVIMKDLPGLFGIENTLELQQFFNVLAYHTGEIMSYKNVAEETNTDQKTIKRYMAYLEAALLLKVLHRVDVTAKRFRNITQFKVHLTNPSLFTGLFGKTDPADDRFPHLVETTIFDQYLHREHSFLRYAQWKRNNLEGEVDLIQLSRNFQKVDWALEVKWSDHIRSEKLKYFMHKQKLAKGIITSKSIFEDTQDLLIVPNSSYAYTVGRNALESV